jgi:hypothetical protein
MSYQPGSKTKLFLENNNVKCVIRKQYVYTKSYYPDISQTLVKNRVVNYMPVWAKENNLDSYLSLAGNWGEELAQINVDFVENLHQVLMKNMPKSYRAIPETNPFRQSISVGTNDSEYNEKRVMKNPIEMTAEDYRTIDVWKKQEVAAVSSNFRGNNKIPVWQRHASVRHLDKSNDGLVHRTPDLASHRMQLHGYDMSKIIDGTKKRIKRKVGSY